MAMVLAGCSVHATDSLVAAPAQDPNDPFAKLEQSLTPLATQCTFNAATGLMTVAIANDEVAFISKRAADSAILQNGQECDVPVTSTSVKKIAVTGSSGANTLILDFTNGFFALGTTSVATTGIAVDLAGGTDTFGIKGTTGADTITFGATGVFLGTDANRDLTVAGAESVTVYLGDGADTFSAAGGGATGGVFGAALSVYGGEGNDTFNQGATSTISETISGGPGTDTVSYASRVAALTVTVGATANDGLAGENDDIQNDVEVVTGGSAGDTMTAASGVAVTFNGGGGNDTLIGDTGADTLNGGAGNDTLRGKGGADTMNGDDGDDTFDEESAANGGDVMNGGAGTDTVDYSARSNALTVTMDGAAANDGESGENDNVKSDVENIIGGSGADNITGNALNNRIDGRDGNDILSGGAGDDVFPQGSAGDGNDIISGGTGDDLVDYSGRSANITAVLDSVIAAGVASSGTNSGDTGASEADKLGNDVEKLWGGSGNDTLTGNASNNELVGGTGDDALFGLAGDDVLEGGGLAEDNDLDCGTGFDVAYGIGSAPGSQTGCEVVGN